MATALQISANRANAQLSSGAATPEGKATSSHNAVKTGLTGQTVLLKNDDVAAYTKHIQRFTDKCSPATEDERALVQDWADTEWRLLRITPLEAAIFAVGRLELAPLVADIADPATRDQLLEGKVFLFYRKDLTNLSLQQTRLNRHRDVVTAKLTALQSERAAKSSGQAKRAAQYFAEAIASNQSFHIADFGFEFSSDDMFAQIAENRAKQNNDRFPEVTKKGYIEDARAEFNAHFGKK